MKQKHHILTALPFVAFFIFSLLVTSCKKEDYDNSNVEYEEEDIYTVVYSVDDRYNNHILSPIFTLNLKYNNQNNEEVILKNIELPWEYSFNIELPFNAYFEGEYVLKDSVELPETINIVKNVTLKIYKNDELINSQFKSSSNSIKKEKIDKFINTKRAKFSLNSIVKK